MEYVDMEYPPEFCRHCGQFVTTADQEEAYAWLLRVFKDPLTFGHLMPCCKACGIKLYRKNRKIRIEPQKS